MNIDKKITGFVGEALVFRELKRRFKVESVWGGGLQKSYDIEFKGVKKQIQISVKTTVNAYRLERIERKTHKIKPAEYQWSNSWGSIDMNNSKMFFVFVDLKNLRSKPDMFIVPSHIVHGYYYKSDRAGRERKRWKSSWPRYHIPVTKLEKYKNNWEILKIYQ